jgi:hypothetical protein
MPFSGHFAPRSFSNTLRLPLVRGLPLAVDLLPGGKLPDSTRAYCSTGLPLLSGDSLKETSGSPKFPGYPFEYMPCSKTPVVSCVLALTYSKLLPSASSMRRLLSDALDLSFRPQLYIFRGSIQSLHPCSAWFRTPLARLTRRLCYCPDG